MASAQQSTASWQITDRQYETLLIALTRKRADVAATEEELDATARRNMADLLEYQQREREEELAEARAGLAPFRAALTDVHERTVASGRSEVPYDSQDPRHNEMADMLIQYLVRTGYAEVRTEEPSEGQYRYWISVNWDALRTLAEPGAQQRPAA